MASKGKEYLPNQYPLGRSLTDLEQKQTESGKSASPDGYGGYIYDESGKIVTMGFQAHAVSFLERNDDPGNEFCKEYIKKFEHLYEKSGAAGDTGDLLNV